MSNYTIFIKEYNGQTNSCTCTADMPGIYIPWYTILARWNRNIISLLQQASAQKPHNFISFIKPTIKLNNAIINSN